MSAFDEVASGLARSQDRLLTRPQLLAHGITDEQIKAALGDGRIDAQHDGVYIYGGGELSWEGRLRAATLAAGSGAEASHRSAIVRHCLVEIPFDVVEINVPYGNRPLPEGVIVHRTRRAEPPVFVGGIATSSVERALLEYGAVVPLGLVEKAYARALRKRKTTTARVRTYLEEHGGRGRAGALNLRLAIERYADGSPPPGSDGETAFYSFLDDRGVERPVRQHRIDRPNGEPADLDFAWPVRMKTLEFDGLESRADSASHDAELARQNDILELGWDLRRFSPVALRDRPHQTYREIARWLSR